MIKYIFRISNLIYRYFFIKNYFSFVLGHSHLDKFKVSEIKKLLNEDYRKSDEIINEYEIKFSTGILGLYYIEIPFRNFRAEIDPN